MLEVKAWVYGKLTASSALVAALGNVDRIVQGYPQVPIALFPLVALWETSQPTSDHYDNKPLGVESTIEMHVFTTEGISTTAITKILDSIMTGLYFNVDFSEDLAEPDTRVNHRVLRYGRMLTALDVL
jgi:hypothetical protein